MHKDRRFRARAPGRSWLLVGLILTGSAALFACAPDPTPTPLPPSATPPLTATPSPAPAASATPTIAPSPTADCLAQPGRIVNAVLDTALLPKPMTYHVYLPPCYDADQARRYPVLYMLHGQGDNEDQWLRLGVPSAADKLIASAAIPPLIIVFPYDYSYLQPTQYRFEDAFIGVLIPQIDLAYRSLPDAAHRAVGGLSRGGAWALHLGIHHPDLFGAIGADSPAIFYSDSGSLRLYLRDIPAERLPRLYIDVGDADSELETDLGFKAFLDGYNIPYEWHEYIGFHDEAYWGAHVEEYLRWYAQGWQSAP